jgi:hypothetical protein
MLKGRFSGVAQNIGDAFCFLILTQPGPDDKTSSQVLARLVICRQWYPREEAPIVAPTLDRSTLTFYCNDGKTLLADPSPIANNDDPDVDPVDDIVAGSLEDLRAMLSPPTAGGATKPLDTFNDSIFEVFGPLSKRLRHLIDDLEDLPLIPLTPASQLPDVDSEERSIFPNFGA